MAASLGAGEDPGIFQRTFGRGAQGHPARVCASLTVRQLPEMIFDGGLLARAERIDKPMRADW